MPGKQPMGWQFTMRQLYDKSGSLARHSDFALDVRKIAASDHLPEYTLGLGRNGERTEVLYIRPRRALPADDPRAQPLRHSRRRVMRGIYFEPLKLPSGSGQEQAPVRFELMAVDHIEPTVHPRGDF